jgi:hypothetical protein
MKLPGHGFLALLASVMLVGCSAVDPDARNNTEAVFTASQIQLLSADLLVDKNSPIDDRRIPGDPETFQPWMPDNFSFQLASGSPTTVRHNWFGFRAQAGSVERDRNLQARWLGPRGYFGYEMLPHGLNFEHPVELLIDISAALATGLWEADELAVYLDNENGTYTLIESEPETEDRADAEDRVLLRARLEHFSKYVIGIGPPPGGEGGN